MRTVTVCIIGLTVSGRQVSLLCVVTKCGGNNVLIMYWQQAPPGGGGIHNYQASIEIKYSDCAKDFNSNVLRILFRVCIVKRILI